MKQHLKQIYNRTNISDKTVFILLKQVQNIGNYKKWINWDCFIWRVISVAWTFTELSKPIKHEHQYLLY